MHVGQTSAVVGLNCYRLYWCDHCHILQHGKLAWRQNRPQLHLHSFQIETYVHIRCVCVCVLVDKRSRSHNVRVHCVTLTFYQAFKRNLPTQMSSHYTKFYWHRKTYSTYIHLFFWSIYKIELPWMLHMYKKYALHLYKYVHNVQNIWHTQ